MRTRRVVAMTGALAGLIAAVTAAQGPAVPRTPWGEPDLQGVWSSDDTAGIPRERPAEIGMRLYQTDEEFAARKKQVQIGVQRGQKPVGRRLMMDFQIERAEVAPAPTERNVDIEAERLAHDRIRNGCGLE